MKVGYARVSTTDQSLENQMSRLAETGCELFFEEKTSGAAKKRPQLENCSGNSARMMSLSSPGSIGWRDQQLSFCVLPKF